MPNPTTALVLGTVTFMDFEVPDEIDMFGGYAALEEHEFSGGVVSITRFGRFPVKSIGWSGQFFVPDQQGSSNFAGNGLFDRVQQIDQLLTTGGPITLTFGPYQYRVELQEFYQKPRNQWWVPYTIKMRPYEDQTNWNQQAGGSPSLPSSGSPGSPPTIIPTISDPNSPLFSNNGSPSLVQNNASLNGLITNDPFASGASVGPTGDVFAPVVPAGIAAATPPISNFQQSLAAGLQSAAGANPNSATLQSQLSTAQAAASTAAASTDPATQAFGLQSGNLLGSISQQLTPTASAIQLAPIANPSLEALAAQYYGDPNQWTTIASYYANVDGNGNKIMTPNPVGMLTLYIPPVATP